jgi:GDP-L-fucose synthase
MFKDPFPVNHADNGRLSFFTAKKVAVTGASGLIGSYAVKLLSEAGAVVKAVVHSRPQNMFTKMAQEIVFSDLMNAEDSALRHVFKGYSVVVSCAGITGGVALPKKDPVSYVGPASVIAMNTLHAAYQAGVERIGWLSSTTVYPPLSRPALEEDSRHPDALFPLYRGIGESKRFLEKLFAYYHETTGIGAAVIRPSGAYGRFDNFDEGTSHVLPGMVTRALRREGGQPFEVWGDGEDVRDFIHAQDVARCLLLAISKDTTARPFNAASGIGVTTKTLARVVLDAVGDPATEISTSPDKPTALRKRLVDTRRAQEELGFEAQISLAEGVRDVVEWVRSSK